MYVWHLNQNSKFTSCIYYGIDWANSYVISVIREATHNLWHWHQITVRLLLHLLLKILMEMVIRNIPQLLMMAAFILGLKQKLQLWRSIYNKHKVVIAEKPVIFKSVLHISICICNICNLTITNRFWFRLHDNVRTSWALL